MRRSPRRYPTYLTPKLNADAREKILSRKLNPSKPYICCTCGTQYSQREKNFLASQSPLYYGNGGFLPICTRCVENQFAQYTQITGSRRRAFELVCAHWDMYIIEAIAETIDDTEDFKWSRYISKLNVTQCKGKTFDTYIEGDLIEKFAPSLEEEEQEEEISRRIIKRWGEGYDNTEYLKMQGKYKELCTAGLDVNPLTEPLIMDLCKIEIQKDRALLSNNPDLYDKMQKLYQTTYTTLMTKSGAPRQAESNENEAYGKWLADIEKYAPAEYVKKNKLFEDVDGVKEYFRRHILRPLKNLLTGSNEMDPEYKVGDDDGISDGI